MKTGSKLRRYTAADIARRVGCHPNTIRRLSDLELIASHRDFNGWRIFGDAELCAEEVRRLMGTEPINLKGPQDLLQSGGGNSIG